MDHTTTTAAPATAGATKTKSRHISKVAVLGSGLMGSGIAAHLAGIGLEVLLLDIVPFDIKDEDKDNKAVRNSIVNGALKAALKSKPAAFHDKKFVSRITTGNFTDDFSKITDCDWIIEVVDGLAANGAEGNEAVEAKVRGEVAELCARFPLYPNLLGQRCLA